MKKLTVMAAALLTALCGCTTVESTQKFNALNLTDSNAKAVCQSYVRISGFYLFGLPIIVGSPFGDGRCTVFQYTGTTENVVHLLTEEARARGASRVINVQVVETTATQLLPGCAMRYMQASGTGVRSASARPASSL